MIIQHAVCVVPIELTLDANRSPLALLPVAVTNTASLK
jgi:hypothetical protein